MAGNSVSGMLYIVKYIIILLSLVSYILEISSLKYLIGLMVSLKF